MEYYWKSQLLSTSIHKYTQRLFVTINLVQCIKSYMNKKHSLQIYHGWNGISLDRALRLVYTVYTHVQQLPKRTMCLLTFSILWNTYLPHDLRKHLNDIMLCCNLFITQNRHTNFKLGMRVNMRRSMGVS